MIADRSVPCSRASEIISDSMYNHTLRSLALLALVAVAGGCASTRAILGETEKSAPLEALEVSPEAFVDTAGGAYVLVDLDRNRLRFMHGDEVLWEAPVGTGTGLRLKSEVGDWDFPRLVASSR